jgi:hypothetical protein
VRPNSVHHPHIRKGSAKASTGRCHRKQSKKHPIIAYLFDVDDFRKTITPVVERLQKDNFALLRLQANEIGENDPGVWKVLEDFRYYAGDLEQEEIEFDEVEDRVRFWMFIIMANRVVPF